jgi:hypothetical protein
MPLSDRKLPKGAQKARRKPLIAGADGLTGWPAPSEACLMRRTDAYSASRRRDPGNPGDRGRVCLSQM